MDYNVISIGSKDGQEVVIHIRKCTLWVAWSQEAESLLRACQLILLFRGDGHEQPGAVTSRDKGWGFMRVPQQNPHYVCFLSRKWQVGGDPLPKQPQFSECQCISQRHVLAGEYGLERREDQGMAETPEAPDGLSQRTEWEVGG